MDGKLKNLKFLILLLPVFYINAYSETSENSVVLEVGKEKYTYSQLEKAFSKNMNRTGTKLHQISRDSLNDFLELFINYRLKVNDAKLKGLEKDSAVMADMAQNRKLLSESFYFDKYLTDAYVNKIVERRNKEKKIALIQTVFMEGPLKDTLAAYNKAKEALERVMDGEDFGIVAKEMSQDPRTAETGGVIDKYITGGIIARPIEDAVYAVGNGEVYPGIVYNKNSYFVLKVVDEVERKYVRGSQILIAPEQIQYMEAAEIKADSILKALKDGADFAYLAQLHSDDAATAINGGDLGEWYSRSTGFIESGRSLLPEVEKALYRLENGEISDVIKSDIGYHIVRRDSTKDADEFGTPREIKIEYKRKYFVEDKEMLMDSLAKAYGFEIKQDALNKLTMVVDTNSTNAKKDWAANVGDDLKNDVLFEYLDKEVSVGGFIDSLNNIRTLRGMPINKSGLKRAMENIVHPQVFMKEIAKLEKTDAEFAALMQEFEDGILLFKVEADEVWNKLKFDSTRAREYYEKRKTQYKTDPSYDISEIYVYDKELADSLYKLAKNGADFAALAEANTQRAGFREKEGKWGLLSVNQNEMAQYAKQQNAKTGDVLEPYKNNSAYSILKINAFEPVRQKTFEEAISDFAPEFQDMMQKELAKKWLEKVREKVKVTVHKDKLMEIIEEKSN